MYFSKNLKNFVLFVYSSRVLVQWITWKIGSHLEGPSFYFGCLFLRLEHQRLVHWKSYMKVSKTLCSKVWKFHRKLENLEDVDIIYPFVLSFTFVKFNAVNLYTQCYILYKNPRKKITEIHIHIYIYRRTVSLFKRMGNKWKNL